MSAQGPEVAGWRRVLGQAWWAPVAAVLALAALWVALAFIYGAGTSNALDAESTVAGATLALGGTVGLVAGLWVRPRRRAVGNALVIAGAVLAAIWFWTVVMTPMALVVIVGVVTGRTRPAAPAGETP